ncbi:MAG: helix-turn-helix domain-containing protein [Rhizobiales bacterium]|nr:helix-turn-helix domain-containing protein [Hyphomicrobiales bacterium]
MLVLEDTAKVEITSLIGDLEDIADLINSGRDTDTTLVKLVMAACRYGGWLRGSIMAIDLARGFANVTVRYDPTLQFEPPADQWELATSPARVALSSNRPVFIPDAQASEEFPGFQRESRIRGYRSVLILPMRCADGMGRPMVLSVISEHCRTLTSNDYALMKLIVHMGSIAVDKQKAIAVQESSARQRDLILRTHTQLLHQALSDDSVQTLSGLVFPAIGRPALIVDITTDNVIVGASPIPAHFDDNAWQGMVESNLRPQLRKLPLEAMSLDTATRTEFRLSSEQGNSDLLAAVYPLRTDGDVVGALIVFGDEGDFSEFDKLRIGSAQLAISVQLMRNLIRFRFERRTLGELLAEIIEGKWQNENDVLQRALKFGIRLNRPHRIIVIDFPGGEKLTQSSLASLQHGLTLSFEKNEAVSVIAVNGPYIILLVAAPKAADEDDLQRLLSRIAREIKHYISMEPTLVLSDVCRTVSDYRQAWMRCLRLLGIARMFDRRGIVSVPALGPLAMLLSTADAADVKSFVGETIGAIRAHDALNGTQFLETLKSFIRAGYRNQECADDLGIHVTTLRYRLNRIAEIFRLDLESSSNRFDLELAIRLSEIIPHASVEAVSG